MPINTYSRAASTATTDWPADFVFLGKYLHKVAQEALYPQLRLYNHGQKVPLPGNRGRIIYIPYFVKEEPIQAMGLSANEHLSPTGYSMSGANYSGIVKGYHGHFQFTDFFWATHEVPGILAAGVRQLAAHMAKIYDEDINTQLWKEGTFVHGTSGLAGATNTLTSSSAMSLKAIFGAEEVLAANDAPSFPDGTYRGVFHPRQMYDLFTNAADITGYGSINFPSWLSTTSGQNKFERAVVGTMGRIMLETSSTSVQAVTGASAVSGSLGMSNSSQSGYNAYVIAPGAYAVVDLQNAPPSIVIQPFGSAGTRRPDQEADDRWYEGVLRAGEDGHCESHGPYRQRYQLCVGGDVNGWKGLQGLCGWNQRQLDQHQAWFHVLEPASDSSRLTSRPGTG